MKWIAFVVSLPTENASVRMRIWRTLKASGVGVLRDGVYLLPHSESGKLLFDSLRTDIEGAAGTAWVLEVAPPEPGRFENLFDRTGEFAALVQRISGVQATLTPSSATEVQRQTRKLRKSFASLVEIDYCPGEAQRQTALALSALESAVASILSPDEPLAVMGAVVVRQRAQYQNRTWASRARPWVDRLASAWLIRRTIDTQAKIVWLAAPLKLPEGAVGFDFDGAEFSHVGARVTFEVLLASFSLTDPALQRLGGVVHFLDAGGIQPPEAAGIESVLAGMLATIPDDDALFAAACSVLDGVYQTFKNGITHG